MKVLSALTMVLILWSFSTYAQDENSNQIKLKNAIAKRFGLSQNTITGELQEVDAANRILFYGKPLSGNGSMLSESIHQNWLGTIWVNSQHELYSYDVSSNLVKYLSQDWNGSDWTNYQQNILAYDVNNNMIEQLTQIWNASGWQNLFKKTYTYNANNYRLECLTHSWEGSSWVYHQKETYTYDLNNNWFKILSEIWDGSTWKNFSKRSFTLDVNYNIHEVLAQVWNGSQWENAWKSISTYDLNDQLIKVLSEIWAQSVWVNDQNWSYTYKLNNQIEWLWQNWDGADWLNYQDYKYNYDGNNNLIEELGLDWDDSTWINSSKTINIYNVTGVENVHSNLDSYELSNNYPNPFNPSTSIKYSIGNRQFVTLKIYDVLGNEIETLVDEEKPAGTYEVEFNSHSGNVRNLTSGVYFYQLKAGTYVEIKKMLLLK